MLEFLARNQDSLILGFFFLIMGFAVGPLIASLFGKRSNNDSSDLPATLPQIIYVDHSVATTQHYTVRSQGASDDSFPLFIFIMTAACLGYFYWRHEVLLTLASLSFFSIGLFIGAALYAYAKDAIDGSGWTIYLLFTSAVSIFSFVLIASALNPTHAPSDLGDFQITLQQQGPGGFLRALGSLETALWMLTHATGVMLLFYVQVRLSLSLAHYLAMLKLHRAPRNSSVTVWFASKTKHYRNPLQNIVLLSLLCCLSYLLINGHAYVWYADFMLHRHT